MPTSVFLDHHSGYAIFRLAGQVTLESATESIVAALAQAGADAVRRLLVDATQLVGLPVPRLGDRFSMAERFAAAAAPGMKVALVLRAEMIDPEKFGVTVARNRGLEADLFSDEPAALAWLTQEFTPPKSGGSAPVGLTHFL